MNIPVKRLALLPLLLQLLLVLAFSFPTVSAKKRGKQDTWKPNEDDSVGPLPLSQQLRQQLHRLEQVIAQSPDPTATLAKAAAAKNMDPHDLMQLLQRNHRDLEMAREAGPLPLTRRGSFWVQRKNRMQRAMTRLVCRLKHAVLKHPRTYGLTGAVIWLLIFASL